ncbi:hypothetical protein [Gordonia phthalatica]|uniref:Uncharacterized protein n=1 Tax=Gordonia phthalatica TaxID=1136941 RepID=A0A0N7FUJ5_9ACTN|nr:hypothetical protein [Gordonia phthalatica]ALG84535.1 hypothetical protein ACH46_08540 [Gordonia phthalatica]
MSRFTDDFKLIPVDEYMPATARELLRHLGVLDGARVDQMAAVERFVVQRRADLRPSLVSSLRRSGFAEALGHVA